MPIPNTLNIVFLFPSPSKPLLQNIEPTLALFHLWKQEKDLSFISIFTFAIILLLSGWILLFLPPPAKVAGACSIRELQKLPSFDRAQCGSHH